ncbi:MAG: 2-C-methyl-D-erythritol 4-phosphate cytidylyltransferase [Kaiparowitsia implicata GSE-PSE-MK54-09C]|nr:2-C-methyl-D-erythritol 4-phosphate cytidylyltransferase [Kaiparowitsia implicata GSE-PSE-MK54-09C]
MHLLIPAAGSGSRMKEEWTRQGKVQRNKLFLPLLGQPILAWTLLAAQSAPTIEWIGLIAQPDDWPDVKTLLATLALTKPVAFIPGGDTRQASVYNGLRDLPSGAARVLIHDGARCLVTPDLLDRCSAALDHCQGFVAAIPVKDTIKVVAPESQVVQATPDRRQLWAAQTPQGFDVAALRHCHDQGVQQRWSVTDDAALFEQGGLPVEIVPGEETNLKVTTPMDLAIAQFILHQRGLDPHQLAFFKT